MLRGRQACGKAEKHAPVAANLQRCGVLLNHAHVTCVPTLARPGGARLQLRWPLRSVGSTVGDLTPKAASRGPTFSRG
jgi:hypothetical protein